MSVKGKVWKYGDDVNTDVIFPGKYTYTIKERADMAKVACEDLDPEFTKNAQPGVLCFLLFTLIEKLPGRDAKTQ